MQKPRLLLNLAVVSLIAIVVDFFAILRICDPSNRDLTSRVVGPGAWLSASVLVVGFVAMLLQPRSRFLRMFEIVGLLGLLLAVPAASEFHMEISQFVSPIMMIPDYFTLRPRDSGLDVFTMIGVGFYAVLSSLPVLGLALIGGLLNVLLSSRPAASVE